MQPDYRPPDIRAHLEEVYGRRCLPILVSRVTGSVSADVFSGLAETRLGADGIPLFSLIALRVKKSRCESRQVKTKAVYVAWAFIFP